MFRSIHGRQGLELNTPIPQHFPPVLDIVQRLIQVVRLLPWRTLLLLTFLSIRGPRDLALNMLILRHCPLAMDMV